MGLKTFDKALELKDVAAVVADAQTTPVLFDAIHAGIFQVDIYVTAIVSNDGDETYIVILEADDAAATGFVEIGRKVIARATGVPQTFTILCHAKDVAILRPNANKLRLNTDVGGTTPSITYGAWVGSAASGVMGMAADLA